MTSGRTSVELCLDLDDVGVDGGDMERASTPIDTAAEYRVGLSPDFGLGAFQDFGKCNERKRGTLNRLANLQIRVGGNSRQVTVGSLLTEKIDFAGDFLGTCGKVYGKFE